MENNMKYYKDNQDNVYAYELDGSQDHLIGDKTPMTVEEVESHLNPVPTTEQQIAKFKSMYLAHVDAKLKELDYDSLASVRLWDDDATFGAEATRILNWYKAIIAMNYKLLNDVGAGTVTMPTEEEYKLMLEGVTY